MQILRDGGPTTKGRGVDHEFEILMAHERVVEARNQVSDSGPGADERRDIEGHTQSRGPTPVPQRTPAPTSALRDRLRTHAFDNRRPPGSV